MAKLDLIDIRKTYPKSDLETLKGINISIEPGEFLILVGPSGCGKSTLMNTIAGLEDISSGEIRINDVDVSGLAPKDRDIAMVFQSYALYPNMTVRENMAFGLKIRKTPTTEIDAEIKRVSELLQIDHLLDRKPSQLSGGQQQRVAMGRALARRPKLYLFDEPLSNLDAKLRVEMRTEVKKLHQRLGTTIVYVTHDQIEAMTLADRIAVMKAGEVQQLGSPYEIYNHPTNMFVAGFMGSPSMNFVPITVLENSDAHACTELTGSDGKAQLLALPDKLKTYVGKKLMLGLRPEHISQQLSHHSETDLISAARFNIEILEPTGPETIAQITINDHAVHCRLAPDLSITAGQDLDLMIDVSKASFFDPDSERNILL
ncbi:sn-glycerol-3-phosphate ABC transporter ATP-binding protein UgpC [Motilimonas cestriensis]|uniref:Sn-glycerol-3-phosphate ABC transporter ATP-binding protein UgpC n=1 Tax=Motilimonas cestriensis TaxID=2742685 RepID=A0ABS8WBB8_9GAMM|nr:sn-glycerol-3-phosphate ABC transporter ATP-binding protein UgpC [Motilimonas cestriensis]MCE2595780.1 sn-glycerol-3-phosphate ABC transporter ATP-binding protein UgpC [Motilimonas cestriensis]